MLRKTSSVLDKVSSSKLPLIDRTAICLSLHYYYSPKYYCWSMPVIAQPSSGFGVGLMAICWRMGFPFYKDYCIPQKALTSALPFLSTEKRWDVLHLLWLGMADGDLLLKNASPSNWSRLKCSICLFCSDADWKWNLFSKYSYLKLGYHHRRNVQFRARSHQAPLEELSSRGWRSTTFTALPICA